MNFLSVRDITKDDLIKIFDLVKEYKNKSVEVLKNKYIGLIFEKPSTRTRISFEIGIQQLRGSVVVLNTNELQISRGELIKDTASVLDRYLDGLVLRVNKHETILEFEKYFKKPIINALSDVEHPCQALSDIYTIIETKKVSLEEINKIKFVFVGDYNNVCASLMNFAQMLGMNAYFIIPKEFQPKKNLFKEITISDDINYIKGADVVYTDVWVSMGQEKETNYRLNIFRKYQLNKELMLRTKEDCSVMHCLPAKRGNEITDEVMDGKNSIVLYQAENRLHVQKGLLGYLFTR